MKIRNLTIALLFAIAIPASSQTLKEAIRLSDNEQYEKAASMFVKLIQKESNNGDNYFWFGENYFRQENLDSAMTLYKKGNDINPNNPLNMVGIGKVNWYRKSLEEAKKPWITALSIVEDKNSKLPPSAKAVVYMKIAECYTNAPIKEFVKAKDYLNKAIKLDPKNPEPYILLGDAIFEENNVNGTDAIVQYKKALELDKTSPKPYVKIGKLYMRSRNYGEANKMFTDAIGVDPTFAPAYRERAESFYMLNQIEKALEDYKKYLQLNSGSVSARVRYGSFLFVAKKYPDAINELKEIQKSNPDINLVNRLLGYSYYESGDVPAGMTSMETYLAKQPKENIIAKDYEYYAKLYQKAGKDSIAAIWYMKMLEIDSNATEAYGEIGNIYNKIKNYPEAVKWFNKKIKSGKNVTVNDYFYIGRAYYNMKEYEKADSAFAEYVKIQSEIPFGYVWRGRCNAAMDPDFKKGGLAKPFYEKVILLVKPEEAEKNKKDLEEAYYYLGSYFLAQKKNACAKYCYEQIKVLNTGSDRFKTSVDVLNKAPEFKGVTADSTCIKP